MNNANATDTSKIIITKDMCERELVRLAELGLTVPALTAERDAYREALEFFAEPYTWSRVWADCRADVRLNDMYGARARAVLARFEKEKP